MTSEHIGKYRILEEIASGGQGAVFRAFDPTTGKIVAVKVLHAQYSSKAAFVERFEREASTIQMIDHENVVKILDVGESEGRHFMALEFIPESLSGLIDATGALPIDRAVQLAIGIADGIGAAHEKNIIHRDIKPQNVLLTPDGVPKVTDFGIARDESLDTMTVTGVMMGTPYYMSPEQADGERATARSDVYSLGCLIYRLLTGDLPFTGDTPLSILRKHADSKAEPIDKKVRSLPSSISKCVEKAMEKDPAKRFADAQELSSALRSAMPGLVAEPSTRQQVEPIPHAPPPPVPATPARSAPARQEPAESVRGRTPQPAAESRSARSDHPGAPKRFATSVGSLISALFNTIAGIVAVVGTLVAVVAAVGYVVISGGADPTTPLDEGTANDQFSPSISAVPAGDDGSGIPVVDSENSGTSGDGSDGIDSGNSSTSDLGSGDSTIPGTDPLPGDDSPLPGLIHLWSGDGIASDTVGGLDTVAFGGVVYTDGVAGQAFSFDGSSGFVEISHSPELEVSVSKDKTVSGWFKTSGSGYVVSKATAGSPDSGWLIEIIEGDLRFAIVDDNSPKEIWAVDVSDNEWHHFSAVHFARSGEMVLYIDGERRGSVVESFGLIDDREIPVRIGIASNGQRPFFGLIDEVAVYERALSHYEVIQEYERGFTSLNSSDPIPVRAGLIHYWSANDGSIDEVGSLDGTLSGADYGEGVLAEAFQFDGRDDYIQLSSQPDLSGGFSFAAWVQLSQQSFEEAQTIFNNGVLTVRKNPSPIDPDNFEFCAVGIGNSISCAWSDTLASAGDWMHIAGTWDGSQTDIYINGVREGHSDGPALLSNQTVEARIGRGTLSDPDASPFHGLIDEIVIFDRPLTDHEIGRLFHALNPAASRANTADFSGLVHHWAAEGNAEDSIGIADGAPKIDVQYTDGVSGLAFDLDIGAFIELPHDVYSRFVDGSSSTLSSWVRPKEEHVDQAPLATYNGAEYGPIWLPSEGVVNAHVYDGEKLVYVTVPIDIPVGEWTHFVQVWDGATIKIYVNGVEVPTSGLTHDSVRILPRDPVFIGAVPVQSSFTGAIDEVMVFDRALSARDVAALHSSISDSGSPVGDVENGQALYLGNCSACHSTGVNTLVGPGHAGVYQRAGMRSSLSAEEYLEQSIREPGAYIVDGFAPIMPSFDHFSDEDITDIIAYLRTLNGDAPPPTATAAPAPTATRTPATATPAPAATAAQAFSPTSTPSPSTSSGPTGSIVRAFRTLESVYGIGYVGPYRNSATNQLGGVEEPLFNYQNGNAMTPFLVDSWDIDAAGTRARITLNSGIDWQAPRGFENTDFGELTASEVVEWFNRSNATTNPDSTYGDAGDFAAIFLEATVIDDYTLEIGLVSPIFFCLPLSQFGCLSAARGPHKVTTADSFGIEWARAHHVGTGPYVQGTDCVPGDRCSVHAVDTHWRRVGNVAQITGIQVPEASTQIAMLRNGAIDMAEIDYKLLTDVVADGFTFLETMPGGFVGQSVMFPGNLWEHSHARTAQALNPWDAPPYEVDYPWIGNPWGTSDSPCFNGDALGHGLCGNAPYSDTNNPAGIDDMEQARLVRLALSTAIDRDGINSVLLNNIGTPIYSEYMGPEYPGWDPVRETGCFDWVGNRIACSGTVQAVPWEIVDSNLGTADALLTSAGYPLVNGSRQGFGKLTLQAYAAEAGPVGLEVADVIMSDWARLGIEIEGLVEDYGGVISPRMRQRVQFLPVLKNGDVHSNVYPLDWPLPTVDTSSSRPGWGVGFESQAGAKWLFEILGQQDASVRIDRHLEWVDYSMFWLQYAGVFQVPKGIVVNDRIKSWVGYQQHYANVSSNPEFIVLN